MQFKIGSCSERERTAAAENVVEFVNNSVKYRGAKYLQRQHIGSVFDKSNFCLFVCLFTVIILCVVEVIIILMLIFLRNRIRIAIALLKEGSRYACLALIDSEFY